MLKPVPRAFFEPAADRVAPELLGRWLIRRTTAGLCGGPIVETEAYLRNDPASHSFKGRTARNRVMWGQPGMAYVYFIYGAHCCVNAVCQPEAVAEAVLIRAIEAALGADLMRTNRPVAPLEELTNGPGKLCDAMAIDRTLDGVDLCSASSPLFIAENPELEDFRERTGPAITTVRIGITKAAHLPLRFCLSKSAFLSRKHRETSERAPKC